MIPTIRRQLPSSPVRARSSDAHRQKNLASSRSTIRAALCSAIETPDPANRQLLERAQIPPQNNPAPATPSCANNSAPSSSAESGCSVSHPARTSGNNSARPESLAACCALTAAHAIQYILWILAWWVVGTNVLHGRADRSWLWFWALLLLTLVPLRVLITWLQGRIAIGAGARLKQRLFFGALRLEPDSIRHQGAGQLLGPRHRNGSGGIAGIERRISGPGGRHRTRSSPSSCSPPARAACCNRRYSRPGWLPSRRHRLAILSPQSHLDRRPPSHDARSGGEHGRAIARAWPNSRPIAGTTAKMKPFERYLTAFESHGQLHHRLARRRAARMAGCSAWLA